MVDMEYMSELTGKSEEELFSDLKGVIFRNPEHGEKIGARPYLMADEYLSGNVREKLTEAKWKAEADPAFADNVEALEKVQPEDLSAAEIGVRLGSTWIPQEDIQDFVHELLGTPCKDTNRYVPAPQSRSDTRRSVQYTRFYFGLRSQVQCG